MRRYSNFTNKAIKVKVWVIEAEYVTQNNLTTIASKNIKATLTLDDPAVLNFRDCQYQYRGGANLVEFDTTCDEQELLLKLLYGNKLTLMSEAVVSPQQTYSWSG